MQTDKEPAEIEALRKLKAALLLEKEEDFEWHRKQVLSLPLERRVQEGYSWYPVSLTKSGYAIGERPFVILEFAGKGKFQHFRSGNTVQLFSRQAGAQPPEMQGVIQFVEKSRMKIIMNAKDLPDWISLGMIGVDLVFDERTYREMEKALDRAINAGKDRLAELRSVLSGRQEASFENRQMQALVAGLNDAQNTAIHEILIARDLAVIHGPPGTGKTTTLVQAIRQLCAVENTVLATAPSNTAVDLLTEKLAEAGLEVVRIGNISRVDDSIISHTLEGKLARHPESKNIKKVKIQAADLRRQAQRYKRRFGQEEREERKNLYREAKALSDWALELEDRLVNQILDAAQVITCTLIGAAHPVLDNRQFKTAIIDEAAQALEPACWVPIGKASKVVLTGDPHQLPPTVKSPEAQRRGLGITMIERCLERVERSSLLNVQYRMNELIMGYSNERFYNGALQASELVRFQKLPIADNDPVVFIDTAGCGFEEAVVEGHLSRFNPGEFTTLREHLYQLTGAFIGGACPSIALISPYKEQVIYMEQQIAQDPVLSAAPITINTIDGFQGQEREVVYISLVRSNEKCEIGFLKDYRRMNVAMTRARKQLIVIGDSATIGVDPFYAGFLEFCEAFGKYLTAWEFML